jgi:hypothetical protein
VRLCLVHETTFYYFLLCSMWLELCLSLTLGDKQKVTDVVTETFFGPDLYIFCKISPAIRDLIYTGKVNAILVSRG